MKRYKVWAFGITLLGISAFGQFPPPLPPSNARNLTFELANIQINNPTYGWLDWSLAVPYWSHSGGADTSFVYYGLPHAGATPWFFLVSSTSPVHTPNSQLAGEFSLAFKSGYQYYNPTLSPIYGPWINSFISQTLPISASAHSIQLLATGPFKVLVGGVEIPMISLGGNSYGGDITSFAGLTAELKIVNTAHEFDQSATIVDNIVFSPAIVPEPGSFALVSLGSLFLLSTRRKAGQR